MDHVAVPLEPGSLVGERFEVERLAGSGGMGVVYCARDLETGGAVALKVLHAADAEGDNRFVREAEVLCSLHRPDIVRHVAHGRTDSGKLYLAMEWLEGED